MLLKYKIIFSTSLLLFFILAIQPWKLYFLNDDFVHIPLSLRAIWIHFEFFRPVPNVITATEVYFFGEEPLGFHIFSIFLHLVATVCVYLLTNHLLAKYANGLKQKNAGFVAACLFFVYPFHMEPVMWIIAQIGTLVTIFILISLIFYLKRSQGPFNFVLSLLSFSIALFTYEISWIAPVFITLISLSDVYLLRKKVNTELKFVLPYWIVFCLFLTIRVIALNQLFSEYDVYGRTTSVIGLGSNFVRLLARTLVPPFENSSFFILTFLFAALTICVSVIYLIRNGSFKFLHLLTLVLVFLSFIPTITLGVDTHGTEGERYLYLPSVFWVLFITFLLFSLPEKVGRFGFYAVSLVFLLLLAKSAGNYRHASYVAEKILSVVGRYSKTGKIIALNLPSNYNGALIFRSGFKEAIQWKYPLLVADQTIVTIADRSFEKIASITVVEPDILRDPELKILNLSERDEIFHAGQKIEYNPRLDLLIFFRNSREGFVIPPTPD